VIFLLVVFLCFMAMIFGIVIAYLITDDTKEREALQRSEAEYAGYCWHIRKAPANTPRRNRCNILTAQEWATFIKSPVSYEHANKKPQPGTFQTAERLRAEYLRDLKAFLDGIDYHTRLATYRFDHAKGEREVPQRGPVVRDDHDEPMSKRRADHLWYGDHYELDWHDRVVGQSLGMDADTYVSNWLEAE
jgi:hypothetical protein